MGGRKKLKKKPQNNSINRCSEALDGNLKDYAPF